MASLTRNGVTVPLPSDLYWADEFAWQPVVQTAERTITGALVLQQAARTAGRPITLRSFSESSGWVTRAAMGALREWASIPQCEMVLSYRENSYNVTWRHHDGNALEATPVVWFSDAQNDDYYTATLNLMEI